MAHQIEDHEISDPEAEYDENADQDFNPDAAGAEEDASSSSSDEEQQSTKIPTSKQPKRGARKRKPDATLDDLDSGDEATIQERKSKKRKKDTSAAQEDEESGGEGGLIKTRAQRLAEKVERKQRKRGVQAGDVTVDVEEVWAALKRIPIGRPPDATPAVVVGEEDKENVDATTTVEEGEGELVTIKRRIEYAGQVTEVEERVPRRSKEAQHYLAEHPELDPSKEHASSADLSRPLKRPSLFEPNPTALVKGVAAEKLRPRAPNRLDVLLAAKRAEEERQRKAERMTTVQKSALDWRGFVAGSEGLREELDEYGKSKRRFLEREDFLGRAQFAREMAGREARLKG